METVKTRTIEPVVQDVLNNGRVEENRFYLPAGQLDRKLYDSVNKVLVAGGGKWNTKAKAHIFPSADAANALQSIIDAGEFVDPKLNGYFPTSPELADIVVQEAMEHLSYATPFGAKCLDPSAGQGALLDALRRYAGGVLCAAYEILPENIAVLQSKQYVVQGEDFLAAAPGQHSYDIIVMNPPFIGTVYIDHILHAWKFLRPGGVLVSILPSMIFDRTGRKAETLRALITECGVDVIENSRDAFAHAGVNVPTHIITLVKPE